MAPGTAAPVMLCMFLNAKSFRKTGNKRFPSPEETIWTTRRYLYGYGDAGGYHSRRQRRFAAK